MEYVDSTCKVTVLPVSVLTNIFILIFNAAEDSRWKKCLVCLVRKTVSLSRFPDIFLGHTQNKEIVLCLCINVEGSATSLDITDTVNVVWDM